MVIKILNFDGGDLLHTIEDDETNEFLKVVNSIDEVNFYWSDEKYIHGKIYSRLYQHDYSENKSKGELLIYIDVISMK